MADFEDLAIPVLGALLMNSFGGNLLGGLMGTGTDLVGAGATALGFPETGASIAGIGGPGFFSAAAPATQVLDTSLAGGDPGVVTFGGTTGAGSGNVGGQGLSLGGGLQGTNVSGDTSFLSSLQNFATSEKGLGVLIPTLATTGVAVANQASQKEERKQRAREAERGRQFTAEQNALTREQTQRENELQRQFQAAQAERARQAAEEQQRLTLGVQAAMQSRDATLAALAARARPPQQSAGVGGLFQGLASTIT